jgi:hypothetical protein
MGGDGGVIASNRRYMRGAGTAEHKEHRDEALEREEMARTMQFCAASGQPLQFSKNTIVTCPYGNLYHKEAAVEALLRRKQEDAVLGDHIRGLKDLHEVRFHITTDSVPTCPITGRELNGNIPAVALIPGRPGQCNVVSERGMQEMGDDFVIEYGPVEEKIRLAPPLDVLGEMKAKLEEKRAKKSKRKRKEQSKEQDRPSKKPATNVTAVARDKVNDAIRENTVFSSLFSRDGAAVSEKDKKDNLFAR